MGCPSEPVFKSGLRFLDIFDLQEQSEHLFHAIGMIELVVFWYDGHVPNLGESPKGRSCRRTQ